MGRWSWIFILEGLLTFLCALPAYFIIPDFPDRAKHLTERERTQWLHHLHKSQGVTTAPVPITRRRIIDAFLDWRTYAYAVLYITIAMPFYGVSLFLPTVIKGLGYTNAQANLFSVPPFAVGFATTLASAWLSDRFSMRGPFLMFWMSLCIIGYAVAITPQSYAVQYGMLFLITGGVSPGIATAIGAFVVSARTDAHSVRRCQLWASPEASDRDGPLLLSRQCRRVRPSTQHELTTKV